MTSRRPPPRQLDFGSLRPTRVVSWLMGINVAIWLILAVGVNFAGSRGLALFTYEYLALTPTHATGDLYLWQPFTYMWLHEFSDPNGGLALGHIFFNMLGLFFLGPPLERRWGQRTFLKFYILAGVIAGLFTIAMGLLIPSWFGGPVVGASGSVLALLAAFSLVMPNAEILLMFIIPIKARYIIWIAVAFDLVMFFASNPRTNSIAVHTHLGGILGAWLLITGNWKPRVAIARWRIFWRKLRGRPGASTGNKKKPPGWQVIDGGRGRGDDDYLN